MNNNRFLGLIILGLSILLISLLTYQIYLKNKCCDLGGVYISGQCVKAEMIKMD